MAVKPPEKRLSGLKGRKPVMVSATARVYTPLILTSDRPLLILPAEHSSGQRYLLFYQRGRRLEKVEPVARVPLEEGLPFRAVELYPLEGPVEYPLESPVVDLVLVRVLPAAPEPGRYFALVYTTGGAVDEGKLRRAVERELGGRYEGLELSEQFISGLTGDPLSSLCLSLGEGGCTLQLAPVVLPGWITIVYPAQASCFSFTLVREKDGGWAKIPFLDSLVGLLASYAPEGGEYASFLLLRAPTVEDSRELAAPGAPYLHESLAWECGCPFVPLPVAWRLPGARPPEGLAEAVYKRCWCEACARNAVKIIEMAGPEWPPVGAEGKA